ncbi:MAG: ParB/RepB/Spo0J family partition protein [Acutalibacteraceae bacterium]|nr:ParB/RepB/Spo0J family partition protein [Acutalibacteraceae bacterium]
MIFNRDSSRLAEIPVIYIFPNKSQPRKFFQEEELTSLSNSIYRNGIIQPLTVRKISSVEYELVAGERRLRAAIMAGFNKVPCIVMKCSDNQSAVFALIENIQRADLNMFEEALAIKKLILECRMTQDQIARQLGKKQSTIANKLRLLKLNEDEQKFIIENKLTERHARLMLKVDEDERIKVLEKIVEESLNVTDSEKYIENMHNKTFEKQIKKQNQKIIIKDVRIFINTLTKAFDTMKLSGVNAISNKIESDEYIEYSVKIPKTSVYNR